MDIDAKNLASVGDKLQILNIDTANANKFEDRIQTILEFINKALSPEARATLESAADVGVSAAQDFTEDDIFNFGDFPEARDLGELEEVEDFRNLTLNSPPPLILTDANRKLASSIGFAPCELLHVSPRARTHTIGAAQTSDTRMETNVTTGTSVEKPLPSIMAFSYTPEIISESDSTSAGSPGMSSTGTAERKRRKSVP
jgi:hypothetical protein